MFKKLLISTCLLFCSSAFCQDYFTYRSQAEAAGNEKNYSKAVELYRQAFRLEAKRSNDYYNAACYAALANDKETAFHWLKQAMQLGYANMSHLKKDLDLQSLHADPRWLVFIEELTQHIAVIEKNYDKPLQKQLLQIYQEDQEARLYLNELEKKYGHNSKEVEVQWESIDKNDKENIVKIEAILQQHGWVGPDKVGSKASDAIFLVIQHASPTIQRKYLPMMREAVKDKRARADSLALLEDRVALGEGRKQIYGSQISIDKQGKTTIRPIEDPDNVDARRASVGLPPLAEYLKYWNLTWDVEAHKKTSLETSK